MKFTIHNEYLLIIVQNMLEMIIVAGYNTKEKKNIDFVTKANSL